MEKLQSLGTSFKYIATEKYDGSTLHSPNIYRIGQLIAAAETDEELQEALQSFEVASKLDVNEVVSAIMDRINKTPTS